MEFPNNEQYFAESQRQEMTGHDNAMMLQGMAPSFPGGNSVDANSGMNGEPMYEQIPGTNMYNMQDDVFGFKSVNNDGAYAFANQNTMFGSCLASSSSPYEDTSSTVTSNERFAQQMTGNAITEHNQLMDNGFNATAEMTSLFMQSTKLVKERDLETIIMTYLTYTHSSNLKARNVRSSFIHSIVHSLKLETAGNLTSLLGYPDPPDELRRNDKRSENVYGDFTEWDKILQVLSFHEDDVKDYLLSEDSDFAHSLPTIKHVLTTLQQIGAETLTMEDKLKVYLLTNIKGVSSLVAMTTFLTDAMPSTFNAQEAVFVFTAYMADVHFSQEEYTNDLAWILSNVIVSETFQEKCIFFMETRQSMLKWSQNEVIKSHVGRVRLRYRIGSKITSSERSSGNAETPGSGEQCFADDGTVAHTVGNASQISQIQEDSLHGWSLRARVPPAISHKSKLLAYLLMSQKSFADPSNAIRSHFVNDAQFCENILTQRVFKPHASVIIEFLRLLTVQVTPFDSLLAFRDECFNDFSFTDTKDLSWLKYLQLYIAAYQHENVWPLVWEQFCSVMSHQVLLSITSFKKKHVYDINRVTEICMQTEEGAEKSVRDVT